MHRVARSFVVNVQLLWGNGLIGRAAVASVPADWLATLHHALLANHRTLGPT